MLPALLLVVVNGNTYAKGTAIRENNIPGITSGKLSGDDRRVGADENAGQLADHVADVAILR